MNQWTFFIAIAISSLSSVTLFSVAQRVFPAREIEARSIRFTSPDGSASIERLTTNDGKPNPSTVIIRRHNGIRDSLVISADGGEKTGLSITRTPAQHGFPLVFVGLSPRNDGMLRLLEQNTTNGITILRNNLNKVDSRGVAMNRHSDSQWVIRHFGALGRFSHDIVFTDPTVGKNRWLDFHPDPFLLPKDKDQGENRYDNSDHW